MPQRGFKKAPGVELMQANCLMCHSSEYIASQPPMPRKFWEASVKKMKEKFEKIPKICPFVFLDDAK